MAADFHYTRPTAKSVPEAITALEQKLPEYKFGVLWHLDMQAKLKEKGVELDRQFHVFEVCSPPHAKRAMETNHEVGYFLPCKLVVYAEANQTYVGLLRPGILIDLLGDERLAGLATEVDATLQAAVDSIAG